MIRLGRTTRSFAIALLALAIGSCASGDGDLTGVDTVKGTISVGVTSSGSSDFGITILLTGPEGFSPRTAAMNLGGTSTFADLDPGAYTVSTTIFGFDCQSVSANVQGGQTTTANIACTRKTGSTTGIVTGIVMGGDAPIGGASVELVAPGVVLRRHTAANGRLTFVGVEAGEYTVTAFHQHFTCPIQTIIVDPAQTTTANISCAPKTTGTITGTVTTGAFDSGEIAGAIVNLTGPASRTATAGSLGSFAFDELQPGTYTVSATFPIMNCQAVSVDVQAARTTTVQINCTFRLPSGSEIEGGWGYSRLLRSQTGSCPLPLPETGTGSMAFNSSNNTIQIVGLDPELAIIGVYDEESGVYAGSGAAVLGDGSTIQSDVTVNFDWDYWGDSLLPVFYTDATPSSVWTRRHRDLSGNLVCTEIYGAGGGRLN
ncbi:MAG TPA: carboxypeptidase-like regulatory domain-containing protein [Gemmatimonadota bacterium]|nr:carboxypeptidase-like regulatory domain-containing protein [Gemmatimonadota bacterium]